MLKEAPASATRIVTVSKIANKIVSAENWVYSPSIQKEEMSARGLLRAKFSG